MATRAPRPALEAFALDASAPAQPILECHLSVHLSGTLAPLLEYRDSLGLGEKARLLDVPSFFPPENRKFLYDPSVTTRFEEIRNDPRAIARLADRLVEVLETLPVKTAVFFPSFALLHKVLEAGLQSQLPGNVFIEYSRVPMGDLWRSIEGWKKDPEGTVLLGVAGGRLSEGIDYPDEELEAVVIVGIPYPRPTARRDALRAYLNASTGKGWEYTMEAPAQRAILQACGRMIRSENDRGIAIVLDRRAPTFSKVLPGSRPHRGPRRDDPCVLRSAREVVTERDARPGRGSPSPGRRRRPPKPISGRSAATEPVIITRTPLRISFAGGGTDLPGILPSLRWRGRDERGHRPVRPRPREREVRPLDPSGLLPHGERRPARRPPAPHLP